MPFFRSAEKVRKLAELALSVSRVIDKEQGKIQIVSHYDADGIASAALLVKTMDILRKEYGLLFVKQLDADSITELSRRNADLWIFSDVGSGDLERLSSSLKGNIIVVDHHQFPDSSHSSRVWHLNPYLVGIDGNQEVSSAGMTYILCRSLTRLIHPYVELALVGACGDMQRRNGFQGVNKLLLEDAELQGRIKSGKGLKLYGRYTKPLYKALEQCDPVILGISGNESASIQFLSHLKIPVKKKDGSWKTLADLTWKEEKTLATALVIEGVKSGIDGKELIGDVYKLSTNYEIQEFVTLLNACGRMLKPGEGVKLCLRQEVDIDRIVADYRKQLGVAINWVKENSGLFRRTEKATYLLVEHKIHDTFIGTVLGVALRSDIKTNVAIGLAHANNGVKVSARAKAPAKGLNLGHAVKAAAQAVSGDGGGHILAAGAKIPFGTEEQFIEEIEKGLP